MTRNLKKREQIGLSNDKIEEKVKELIPETLNMISPSSIYHSFSKNNSPEFARSLWDHASQKALSLSFIVTTIGPQIEREIIDARQAENRSRAEFLEAIAVEALDQSSNFILKLLSDEAKADSCECSPPFPIDSSLIRGCLDLLEANRIDISTDPSSRLIPLYTRLSFCFWNPLSKK